MCNTCHVSSCKHDTGHWCILWFKDVSWCTCKELVSRTSSWYVHICIYILIYTHTIYIYMCVYVCTVNVTLHTVTHSVPTPCTMSRYTVYVYCDINYSTTLVCPSVWFPSVCWYFHRCWCADMCVSVSSVCTVCAGVHCLCWCALWTCKKTCKPFCALPIGTSSLPTRSPVNQLTHCPPINKQATPCH